MRWNLAEKHGDKGNPMDNPAIRQPDKAKHNNGGEPGQVFVN
jgi:hypothetical protein